SVDRDEVDPALRVVVLERLAGVVAERDDVAVPRELLHERRLADDGQVGRVAALDLGADRRGTLVAEARVVDGGPRLVLETLQDEFEVLLLGAGPRRHDLEGGPRELAVASAVAAVAGASGECERADRDDRDRRCP